MQKLKVKLRRNLRYIRRLMLTLGLLKHIKLGAVVMSLKKWFAEKWVNIGKKKDGSFAPCGRPKAKLTSKGYPKCVPVAKAASMSPSEIKSAVTRKRAKKQGIKGKPTMVKTYAPNRSKPSR